MRHSASMSYPCYHKGVAGAWRCCLHNGHVLDQSLYITFALSLFYIFSLSNKHGYKQYTECMDWTRACTCQYRTLIIWDHVIPDTEKFTIHLPRQHWFDPTYNLVHQQVPSWREFALRWRQNGRDSVSNHQSHDCLYNRVFRRRSKQTSKLRVTGLCAGNSSWAGEFPA